MDAAAAILRALAVPGPAATEAPVLLVAAHPDDEVIGAGSRLPRLRAAHLAYVTDGAPRDMRDAERLGFPTREAYAAARLQEADRALEVLGVPPARAHRLGFVDQEAVRHLPELTRALIRLIRDLAPVAVLTHAYEGGHPDHDAAALAVHLACRLLRDAGLRPPAVLEFAGYHDPDGSGSLAVLEFLPGGPEPLTVCLDGGERALKHEAAACHRTQAEVLRQFPLEIERYRRAPAYDFLAPPHPWRPFYESFVDRVDGESWCRLAGEALRGFGVAGRL